MAENIFISVGRRATKKQEDFRQRIILLLAEEGFSVKEAPYSKQKPLQKIAEVMHECSGAIVIAHERLYIENAVEMRGSTTPRTVKKVKLPTVWNQIESAMAYVCDLPLLVICDKGSRDEGLLERGYDWYVEQMEIDPVELDSEDFKDAFRDWKERVQAGVRTKPKPNEVSRKDLSLRDFFLGLSAGFSIEMAVLLGGALVSLLGAAFAAGKYFKP